MLQTTKTINNKNKKTENWIFAIYVVLTMAIYILPATKLIVPYIIVALIMLGSLFFTLIKQDDTFLLLFVLAFLSIVYALLSWCVGFTLVDGINEGIRNVRFFVPAFWAIYAIRYCNTKQKMLCLLVVAILILFIFIKTTVALEEDPWIARILAQDKTTSSSEINKYRLQNIGGFEFSYMMGIITLCMMYAMLKIRKILLKILFLVITVFCFNYIIQTMYTTLLLLTCVGIVILIFFNSKNLIFKIALFAICAFTVFYLEDIFLFLSNVFPEDSLLSSKFDSIYKTLTDGDLNNLGSRPQLILDSLKEWIKNPIFGKYNAKLNSHSMIISILVQTGIIGLLIIGFLFCIITNRVLKILKSQNLPTVLFKTSIIFIILLAFLNPVGYIFELTIAVYFIVPLFIELIYKFNTKLINKTK